MNQTHLKKLMADWTAAKAAEDIARERRLAIETLICHEMPASAPEEALKAEINGYRLRVIYKVNRSVDSERLQQLWDALPDKARECFRWKAEVKLRELRAVQELLPDTYAQLVPAIETKPAKPSIAIEQMEVA